MPKVKKNSRQADISEVLAWRALATRLIRFRSIGDSGLTKEEIAIDDALGVNDTAVQVLDDETLRTIAQELVRAVRNLVTIDWTLQENVRAKMPVMVKGILHRCGYPPDKQGKATQTLFEAGRGAVPRLGCGVMEQDRHDRQRV